MKITLGRATSWILFLLAWPCSLFAQQGTANLNAILRGDPSTSSPVLEHLAKGVRVTLVDASPDSGFYHVKTEDDQIGWVFAEYIIVSPPPINPVPPETPVTPPPTTSGACEPNLWKHVYHSSRLQCIEVAGTIVDATANEQTKRPEGVRHEADGDTHGMAQGGPRISESVECRQYE
jgi:hypothetical protein